MHSGAAHDTMCVAERVPSAMVFVPCKDGVSHHPAEDATRPTPRWRRRSSSRRSPRWRDEGARGPERAEHTNDQTPTSSANASPVRAVPARIVRAPNPLTKPIAVAGLPG